jgi:hypothetical protein
MVKSKLGTLFENRTIVEKNGHRERPTSTFLTSSVANASVPERIPKWNSSRSSAKGNLGIFENG